MRRLVLAAFLLAPVAASAHQAPSGWAYPTECCSGRDCAEIPASAVTEGPDGYHVSLPVGSHPMLKTRGYNGVVPYSAARSSPDGEYHICLGIDGYSRFCFFAGARAY